MQDSGLQECIRLIYPGPHTAEYIMGGMSFDKAVRGHLLIDAGMIVHIMTKNFSDAELDEARLLIKRTIEEKLGAHQSFPLSFDQATEEEVR